MINVNTPNAINPTAALVQRLDRIEAKVDAVLKMLQAGNAPATSDSRHDMPTTAKWVRST
jgi:hypothetical protein